VTDETGGDPVRTFTLEEMGRLTVQLEAIVRRVHAGEFRERPLTLSLLCDFHHAVFHGVRDHAGHIRRRGFGAEHLTFGPHRSTHRNDVERELEAIFTRAARDLRAVVGQDDDEYDLRAIELAVTTHADIIRVHPFEDGNGRSSRLCASHLLVALGLHPVAIEAVKQEYTEALNHYFVTKDRGPLVDLFVRLYPVGR
jgi:fido (protein-threonine AMPylation protein)